MSQPDAAVKLEACLIAAADALAELPPREWQRLCRQEASQIITSMQYFEAMGIPDSFPPEHVLGNRIIRALANRHPHLLGDPPDSA
jgi:hypothetical protein